MYSSDGYFDHIPYNKKSIKAIFVGSTTGGGLISIDRIKHHSVPRINSALYFKNNKYCDFKLPNIVHCDNQETENFIKNNICSSPMLSWDDQLKYRFLISIDGNGATCSRVNKSLMSNSVLLKYDSDSILYYFPLLKPWVHYIPISSDADVIKVVETELANPGHYQEIPENASKFVRNHLHYADIYRYTTDLINGYSKLMKFTPDEVDDNFGANSGMGFSRYLMTNISGHVQNLGDLRGNDDALGTLGSKLAIEGICFEFPKSLVKKVSNFQYRITNRDRVQDWKSLGEFAGTRSENSPILGIEFKISSDFLLDYSFALEITTVDGTQQQQVIENEYTAITCMPALEYLKLKMVPRSLRKRN
jgi:hypothetical protein